jgi:hypothetical protein
VSTSSTFTVQALLRTLASYVPTALRSLRDGDGDPASIEAWASQYRLRSAQVTKAAVELREWWAANPKGAAALRVSPWCVTFDWGLGRWSGPREDVQRGLSDFYITPEEKQVLARVETSLLSDISLTDWRQEADAYWRELQKVRGVNTHRRGNPETLLQYVDWFVQRRVLQRTVAEIASKEPTRTPATIRKGVRLVGLDTGILSKPQKRKFAR